MSIGILYLGSSPAEEGCVQVGTEGYYDLAYAECRRYIALIRWVVGHEPPGVQFVIKSNPHDLGYYLEVVCEFDEGNEEAIAYAFRCERDAPLSWKSE